MLFVLGLHQYEQHICIYLFICSFLRLGPISLRAPSLDIPSSLGKLFFASWNHFWLAAFGEKSRDINTRSRSRPPFFSLSPDLNTSLCISNSTLARNKQLLTPKAELGLGLEGRMAAGVCVCVWWLLKSNVTAPGYCGDCKGRCCRRRFEVLNDPGAAWLMEWFTQYSPASRPSASGKPGHVIFLRASRSRSAKPGREPTETTGLLVDSPSPLWSSHARSHWAPCT